MLVGAGRIRRSDACLNLDKVTGVYRQGGGRHRHAGSLNERRFHLLAGGDTGNSDGYSDSYPSWSSNGHWIMCASRRLDDNYSRVFFAYFNNGKVSKAFLLPQEDPEMHISLLKSYNRPEFMVEPVKISVEEFSRVFDK